MLGGALRIAFRCTCSETPDLLDLEAFLHAVLSHRNALLCDHLDTTWISQLRLAPLRSRMLDDNHPRDTVQRPRLALQAPPHAKNTRLEHYRDIT